jgi:hypothetical protein
MKHMTTTQFHSLDKELKDETETSPDFTLDLPVQS